LGTRRIFITFAIVFGFFKNKSNFISKSQIIQTSFSILFASKFTH